MALPKVLERKFAKMEQQHRQDDDSDDLSVSLSEVIDKDDIQDQQDGGDDLSRLNQFLTDSEDDEIEEDNKGKPDLRIVKDDDDEEDIDESVTLDTFFTDSKEDNKGASPELKALMDEVKSLKADLADARKKPGKQVQDINVAFDLSTEQLTQYKSAIPVIEKVAAAVVTQILNERMSDLIDGAIAPVRSDLEGKFSALQTDLTTMSEKGFLSQVRRDIPDVDKLIKSRKFVTASNGVEPTTGESYGTLMAKAYKARNVSAFVNIINILRPEDKKAPRRRSKSSTNTRTTPSNRSKHKFTTSDYVNMTSMFSRGQVPHDKMEKFMKAFSKARNEGLVLDDMQR